MCREHCIPRIREERDIELKCQTFLGHFIKEADNRLESMQIETDSIKAILNDGPEQVGPNCYNQSETGRHGQRGMYQYQ